MLQSIPPTHNPDLTTLAIGFADIGSSTGAAIITLVIALVLLAVGQRLNAFKLVAIMMLAGGLNEGIKRLVGDARPDVFASPYPAKGFSFPSGHAAMAVALYGTLALFSGRWFAVLPCAAMILGICWCRLYLGVHWPTDVLAGVLVGTFAIAAVFAICAALRKEPSQIS